MVTSANREKALRALAEILHSHYAAQKEPTLFDFLVPLSTIQDELENKWKFKKFALSEISSLRQEAINKYFKLRIYPNWRENEELSKRLLSEFQKNRLTEAIVLNVPPDSTDMAISEILGRRAAEYFEQ